MRTAWSRNLISLVLFALALALAGGDFAWASNSGVTYQGRILKPDGTPLAGATTQFKMQLRTPDSQNCLMYEEVQSLDMRTSNGAFSLTMNDGSGSRTDSTGLTLDKVFANHGSMTFDPTTCSSSPGLYSPNPADGRSLVVLFKDETMPTWEPMPATRINFVPFAFEAKQVAGFTINNLVRVAESDGTLDSVSPLSNANYTELLALIAGTSAQYTKQSAAAGSVVAAVGGSGNVASPTTGSVWLDTTAGNLKFYDGTSVKTIGTSGGSVSSVATGTGLTGGPITTSGTISLATLGSGGTGFKTTYDAYGRVTAAVALVEGDIPNLTTAGHVSGSAINAGTIGGMTAINTSGTISSGAITSSGLITSPSLSSTAIGTQSLQVFETTNSFKVTLQAPAALGANYVLTLPPTAGSPNQVLTTNGSGVLTWSTPAGTGVSSIGVTAPVASTGGATPTLSMAKSTASVDGYLAATDFTTFNGKQSSTLTSAHLWVGNSSNVATDLAMTGDVALTNGGVTTVNAVKGKTVSAVPTTTGQVLRYDGTNWTPNFIAMADLRSTVTGASAAASCSPGQTLTYTSVSDNLACTTIAINDSQITYASQAANSFLASPSTGAGAPSFRTLVASDLPSTGAGAIFLNGGNAFGGVSNLGNTDSFNLNIVTAGSPRLTVASGGSVGIGVTTPTATLHLKAGVATTGGAPLKLTAGANLTTPEAGAIEFDGTNLYFTNSSNARQTIGVAGAGLTALTGDVTATGPGSAAATVAQVGGVTAANVALGANAANAATNANTVSTIVKRDPSGNFTAGTATLTSAAVSSVVYKDSGANTVTLSAPTTVSSSYAMRWPTSVAGVSGQVLTSDTSGNLSWTTPSGSPSGTASGDLSGSYPSPTVATVGSSSAANIHTAELAVNSAASANTASKLVLRDGTGNFAANVITGNGLTLNNGGSLLNIVSPVGGAWTMTLPATAGSSGQVLTSGGAGGLLSWSPPSAATQWTTTGSDIYYNTGKVGIGTTTPSSSLEITSADTVSSAGGLRISETGTSSGYISLADSTTSANQFSPKIETKSAGPTRNLTIENNISAANDTGSTPVLAFNAVAASASVATRPIFDFQNNGASKMMMLATGNVGIGTTSPGAKLDVNGAIKSTITSVAAPATTGFDLSQGNIQYTGVGCTGVTWNITNMVQGASYTIVIQGSTHTGTCSFSDGASTFKYQPLNATPTNGHDVMYSLMKVGTSVYVSWIDNW